MNNLKLKDIKGLEKLVLQEIPHDAFDVIKKLIFYSFSIHKLINQVVKTRFLVKELEPRRVKIGLVSEFYDITRKQSQVNILHKNKSLGFVWPLSMLIYAWKERLFHA